MLNTFSPLEVLRIRVAQILPLDFLNRGLSVENVAVTAEEFRAIKIKTIRSGKFGRKKAMIKWPHGYDRWYPLENARALEAIREGETPVILSLRSYENKSFVVMFPAGF